MSHESDTGIPIVLVAGGGTDGSPELGAQADGAAAAPAGTSTSSTAGTVPVTATASGTGRNLPLAVKNADSDAG